MSESAPTSEAKSRPPSGVESPSYRPPTGPPLRLNGDERTAVRRPDRLGWIIFPRDRLRLRDMTVDLHIELARVDPERDNSRTSERALASGWAALPLPPMTTGAGAALAAVLALVALAGVAASGGVPGPGYVEALTGLGDLAVALIVTGVVVFFLLWLEGALLADWVSGNAPMAWIRWGLPRVEPVCWRLGVPAVAAGLMVLLALTFYAVSSSWRPLAPVLTAGLGAGAILYLVQALYPLRPGPGSRLLERLTGVRDLPTQLRWSLMQRFLPVPAHAEVRGTRPMAVAALGLAAWASGAGWALHTLSPPAPGGATLAGNVWRLGAAGALALWALWLVYRIGLLFLNASRMSSQATLRSLEPPEELQRAWAEENPVNRHIPELRSATWKWAVAPQGSLLIRHGSEERDFYWLGGGAVHVIGRSPGGDPLHLATLHGGSGIGEISLIEGRPRTADILVAEDAVVAVLEHPEFESVADDDVRRRFGEVIRASQALSRSQVFWNLIPDDRPRWLAHGSPERCHPGDVIIRQGEPQRWIGLLVDGRIAVEQDGEKVATLEPDSVFGEMAYLDRTPRTATLTAVAPVLFWRWDSEWLDEELVRAGLADEVRALAKERSHAVR